MKFFLFLSILAVSTFSIENKHQKQAVMLSYESHSFVLSSFPADTSWSIVAIDVGSNTITPEHLQKFKDSAKLVGFIALRLLYSNEIANVIVE